jgi:DNA-binding winged helix-turn-helix (wHTH) protein
VRGRRYNAVVPLRFGSFVLDADTRQLLFNNEEIHLAPKAFELLLLLLVNRPRALSKTELQERLWPSTFVEETNLAGLVAEIRRALRDSATRPVYLRTVYRFGYRFVGDVLESAAPVPPGLTSGRPYLIFEGRRIALLEGANTVGRASDAAIQCQVSGVSRHHARIVVAGDRATLEDLGSKNGTYVRRKRITSAGLEDGDEIRLGKASLTFRIDPPLDATDTVAADSVGPTR